MSAHNYGYLRTRRSKAKAVIAQERRAREAARKDPAPAVQPTAMKDRT